MSNHSSRRESESFVYPKLNLSSKDATFSNFNVYVPSIEEFLKVVEFYQILAFQVVKQSEHRQPIVELGTDITIHREAWLTLFSNASQSSLTIRVVHLVPPSEDFFDSNHTSDLALTFVLKSVLSENNIEYELHKENSAEKKVVITKDPIGNKIIIRPENDSYNITVKTIESTLQSKQSVKSKPLPQLINYSFGEKKTRIGILTSGGDAQGMNAAVRSIVRVAISRNCEPFLIYDGYNGLISGGDKIVEAKWTDVNGFLTLGGTAIGTARCKEFREYQGRQIAALNIIKHGISSLIVIGGDGSLTGADNLRGEWSSHVDDLLKSEKISQEEASKYNSLMIVGLVGSIDNDLATTDITIGASTSLSRICESLDALQSTASSHHRAFVVEVMGRNCGWLALSAAICTGADYVFIPEDPPVGTNWEDRMCQALKNSRDAGKRTSLVIVAEGAVDSNLKPISAEYLKDVLTEKLNYDTRVTILGHVQRGGSPVFYDRYLASVQGAEAVSAILSATNETPSLVIGILENKITAQPLKEAIRLTSLVSKEISNKNFTRALELRSSSFLNQLKYYKEIATFHIDGRDLVPQNKRLNIAIIHVGAPAGGINLATRSAVRLCINRGHTPLLVHNGFPGLMRGEVSVADWMQVDTWTVAGGSKLGMNRDQPSLQFGAVARTMQKLNIQGMILIGGFEAYTSLIELSAHRKEYIAFCIPMVLIPATISNNVPGTELSLGSDTAINFIANSCDNIKLSASSNRKRIFVIEVQGGRSGYLAVMGGLAGGASIVYIPEEKLDLKMLSKDIDYLKSVYKRETGQSQGRIALYNETASKTYSLDSLSKIFTGESDDLFMARTAILGHLQQGGTPSPLDRMHASGFAVEAINWIQSKCWEAMDTMDHPDAKPTRIDGLRRNTYPEVYTRSVDSIAVVGAMGSDIKFSSVDELATHTDFKNRNNKETWWMSIRSLIDILSGNKLDKFGKESKYEPTAVYLNEKDLENYYFNMEKIASLVD
ncbi:ATP-dependent 6-phosphofructokinase [Smittium mucronatum]|uniref:6-phosphofructokinase n=1 Tax=Smittium mucronatum TaxID=133383 RepID=A0A1R0GUL0_9FUNG|nr:ATP-dependent 6-phosphofructokinase [Smittium mucronatum]